MTIPANEIVSVIPSVVAPSGVGVDLTGVFLTTSARMPVGQYLTFVNAQEVVDYFGIGSPEANVAAIYFAGFVGSNILPGSIAFWAYAPVAVAGWLRGATPPGGATVANINTISGTLSVTVDGTPYNAGALDLSAAASLTAAAATIATALALGVHGTVAWDAIANAFTITSATTGSTSTVTAATGTTAAALGLAASDAPTISPGAAITTPAATMTALTLASTDWVDFTLVHDPDSGTPSTPTVKMEFAAWTTAQNNRYLFVAWDQDPNAAVANNMTCMGALIAAGAYSGIAPVYAPVLGVSEAAFVMGAIAAIDRSETNGRITLAFKRSPGMTPDVTDANAAANLIANGYNFYGKYATPTQRFQFFYPGQVSGPFAWIDSYVNQIALNADFQVALMDLLIAAKSLPYAQPGYDMTLASMRDPIDAALNFGSIVAGIPLSASEAAAVNQMAGVKIDGVLTAQGWYAQIKPATATARSLRQTPPMTFWYTDGQSIQKMNLASVEVQ